MAIEVIEKIDSRESTTGKSATVDLTYIITGTSDDIAAKAALAATAPSYYDGLVRQSRHITPVGDPTETLTWEGTARYAPYDNSPPDTGDSTFSFDTGGGTQHITQSLSTVNSYAASGTPPDFGGAVGVANDNVEGVDITVPVYNFSETHYLAPATVDGAYKATLFSLTGKVNSDAFRGFSPGEVLFLGAAGTRRGTGSDDDWEIQYRFAASPNRTGLTVGAITGVEKKGWEYMWVRYADDVDDAAKALIKKPVAVYIEKVYDDAAFSGLGI
jgi:hypothetical protein